MHHSKPVSLHITVSTALPQDSGLALSVKPAKSPQHEVTALLAKLKQAQEEEAEARTRVKELREEIEEKEKGVRRMEELHVVNQEAVMNYQKELAGVRTTNTHANLLSQKDLRESSLQSQALLLTQAISDHSASLARHSLPSLPESHPDKMAHLLLAQLSLYQTQLSQRQRDIQEFVDRYSRLIGAAKEDISRVSIERKEAAAARLEDMKRVLKLTRIEAYTTGAIRAHGGKPTDEIAVEATSEVIRKLKEKVSDVGESTEYWAAVEVKLRSRGIDVDS